MRKVDDGEDQEWYTWNQEWYTRYQEWYTRYQEWYTRDQEWYTQDQKWYTQGLGMVYTDKIMLFIVATNVIASRPPERRPAETPTARVKKFQGQPLNRHPHLLGFLLTLIFKG